MIGRPGRVVELSLDERTGSRLESKDRYLFGRFDLDIRLVAGESAGTITSFYICTGGARHDEVDFEFLGNVSGEPYLLHTNIFSDGKGEREQQFVLWFDPTADFHTYSILWNQLNIMYPVHRRHADQGVQEQRGERGAVPDPAAGARFREHLERGGVGDAGGRVKTNWSEAPFVAAYRRFDASSACVWRGNGATTRCGGDHLRSSASSWMGQTLDWWSWMTLNWVRMNYMAYDYCEDRKRYPHGFPTECIIPIGRI
ncbi:hypothetical protein ACQ4PT_064968 [Festuca glaucescens]